MTRPVDNVIDPKAFWAAQGMRAIGSAIVTSADGDGPQGFLALSASHLSASPPLMSVAVSPSTSALETIRRSGSFAINYLGVGSENILARFAGPDARKGAARFDGVTCTRLVSASPILPGIVGAMDCVLEDELLIAGTHLVVGRIQAVTQETGVAPVVHFQGKTKILA